VTRLETDVCGLQHRQELLLKRVRPMMVWLIRNVLLHTLQLGWADAETSVTLLPRKEAIGFSHPSAGVSLQGSHGIRQRHIRREDYEHVNVVFHAAYGKHLHAVIAADPREVVPQPRLMFGTNALTCADWC